MRYAHDHEFKRTERGIAHTLPQRGRHAHHKGCFICGKRHGPYYTQVQRMDQFVDDALVIFCAECAPDHMPRFDELAPNDPPEPKREG